MVRRSGGILVSESKVARQPDGAAMMANVNHQRAFFGDLVSWSPRGEEVYGHHMIPKFACDYDLKVWCWIVKVWNRRDVPNALCFNQRQ